MSKRLLKRFAGPGGLVAAAIVLAGGFAFAAGNGPYAFYFGVPGGGGVACTSQTRTASAGLAPTIQVDLTGTKASGGGAGAGYGNFTAASTSCSQLSGSYFVTINSGSGYQWIDANDYAGEHIKLMGGTNLFEGPQIFQGYWKT